MSGSRAPGAQLPCQLLQRPACHQPLRVREAQIPHKTPCIEVLPIPALLQAENSHRMEFRAGSGMNPQVHEASERVLTI